MVAVRRTPPKVVTFDFWNTLIRADADPRDRRVDAWLGVLEGEGIALERSRLHEAVGESWGAFLAAWRNNTTYGAADAVDDVLGQLGLTPPPAVRSALVEVVTDPSPEHHPLPTEHIEECLGTLRAAGIRIGIICDVGLEPSTTLRRFLDGHGLLGYFDHWSFSDEVGTFKPDPAIFHHALDGLGGADPRDAAHIGDLRRTDVAGALALGITAVRYTGVFDDKGKADDGTADVEADIVLADHADLATALGL
jgi:putative hydrolase of the HAD superfamily